MANKDSFYFQSDSDTKFTKTANLDSPQFIGTPTVPTPEQGDYARLVNVEFIKKYVEDKIHRFTFHSNSVEDYEIQLYGNKEYIINVSGLIEMQASETVFTRLGSIALCDSEDNLISRMDTPSDSFHSTGGLMQSGTLVIRTPINGIVRAYVNFGGSSGRLPAKHICAVEVDRDEYVTVHLKQKVNQTLYFIANGERYSGNEVLISNRSVYTLTAVPEIGYIPGAIGPSTSGVLDGDATFEIEDAVYSPCTITINQSPNQTIYVEFEGNEYIESFVGRYGGTYTVRIESSYGYTAGTLNITEGNIVGDVTIYATPAKAIYRMVSIVQKPHQTVTLTRMDTGATTTTSFNVPQGTQVLAEVEAEDGYLPGELSVDQFFTVEEQDIVVTVSEAIPRE